jgi:tetratricopeptide (TPR) repeat protein
MKNISKSRCIIFLISPFLLLHCGISQASQMYYCGHGNLDDRIASCTEILSEYGLSNEDYARAYDGRCWALNLRGHYREAIPDCLKAIKFNPGYHYAYNNLGVALEGRGRFSEAFTEYSKAVQLKPNFKAARDNLDRVSSILSNSSNYQKPSSPSSNQEISHEPSTTTKSSACQKYPDMC